MTDEQIEKTRERFFEKFTFNHSGAIYFKSGIYPDEMFYFIKKETTTAYTQGREDASGELFLELLAHFNDYDVPLTMTAENVREIITTLSKEDKTEE